MEKKQGRPVNFQSEEIKIIIDQYVLYTEGKIIISASRVAKFARKQLHISNFKYYVIQRNEETKKYLEDINERIRNNSISQSGSPIAVFNTIDIGAYLKMSQQRLQMALQNLNKMLEDVSDKHSKVIQENLALICQNIELKSEIERNNAELEISRQTSRDKINSLNAIIEQKKQKLVELETIINISWDKEAENILKKQRIIEGDANEINENLTIIDPSFNLRKIANIKKVGCKQESDVSSEVTVRQGRANFLKDLEEL